MSDINFIASGNRAAYHGFGQPTWHRAKVRLDGDCKPYYVTWCSDRKLGGKWGQLEQETLGNGALRCATCFGLRSWGDKI